MKTVRLNESLRGGWEARAGTAKAQRRKVSKRLPRDWRPPLALVVRLTRISAGEVDDDSLPAAMKHVRDAVAAWLGVDDASKLVRFVYAQEKGEAKKPAVRIEVLPPERLEQLIAGLEGVKLKLDPVRLAAMQRETEEELALLRTERSSRPRRLSEPTLAALAVSATHRPKKPIACADCTNRVHEQRWDGSCECACHSPERAP